MNTITGKEQLKGKGLVNILHALPNRRCELLRDRLYSIISLAPEGPKITVDYGSSDCSVYAQVMQACERSMCICSAVVIANDLAWESSLDPSLEEITAKFSMYTHIGSSMSWPILHKYGLCIPCGTHLFSKLWQPGPGHLLCLHDICSSVQGFHLYLSTIAPTEGQIFSTRAGVLYNKDVADEVSITRDIGSSLFRIELDPLGDVCKAIYRVKAQDKWSLCEKARHNKGQFTIRPLYPSKDDPEGPDSPDLPSYMSNMKWLPLELGGFVG
jgi:hypothetical protein